MRRRSTEQAATKFSSLEPEGAISEGAWIYVVDHG
jgi:hypothetical protein